MKKLFIGILLSLVSCMEITRYDEPVYVDIQVNIINKMHNDIMNYLNDDIEKNLIYEWDGNIIEGKLDTIECYMFNVSKSDTLQTEVTVDSNKSVPMDINDTYNFLAYGKTQKATYYIGNNKFISKSNKIEKTNNFQFEEDLDRIEESEEMYSKYNEDILSQLDFSNKRVENGTIIYDCTIDSNLSPVTYVYVLQIVIVNDDETIPMKVDSCNYMGVNGVASGVDLFTYEPINERGMIEVSDIKPLQHHNNYSVFFGKVITYGVPSSESSWNNAHQCELGMQFDLNDKSIKKGKTNITNKITEKPYGGVITIKLKNSDISKETIDNGFNINVEIWNIHEINIDF